MNEDYELMMELQVRVHSCNELLNWQPMDDNQIHETLIQRDLLATILWDLVAEEMVKPH